jgi:hypothetical protein
MGVVDLEMYCCRTDIRLLVLTDRFAAGLGRRHLLRAALVAHTAATRMFLSVQKLTRNNAGEHRRHNQRKQRKDRQKSYSKPHQ